MKKMNKNEIAYIMGAIHDSKPDTPDGKIRIETAMAELSEVLRSVGLVTELQVSPSAMHHALRAFVYHMADPGKYPLEGEMSTVGMGADGKVWIDGANPANLAAILGFLALHHDLKWIKFCGHCGRLFVAKNSKGKYCSVKCKNKKNYYKRMKQANK